MSSFHNHHNSDLNSAGLGSTTTDAQFSKDYREARQIFENLAGLIGVHNEAVDSVEYIQPYDYEIVIGQFRDIAEELFKDAVALSQNMQLWTSKGYEILFESAGKVVGTMLELKESFDELAAEIPASAPLIPAEPIERLTVCSGRFTEAMNGFEAAIERERFSEPDTMKPSHYIKTVVGAAALLAVLYFLKKSN